MEAVGGEAVTDGRTCAFCGETIPWKGYQGKSSATVRCRLIRRYGLGAGEAKGDE